MQEPKVVFGARQERSPNEADLFKGSGGNTMEVDQGDALGNPATGSNQFKHVLGTSSFDQRAFLSDPALDANQEGAQNGHSVFMDASPIGPQPSPIQPSDPRTRKSERSGDSSRGTPSEKQHLRRTSCSTKGKHRGIKNREGKDCITDH